MTFYGYGFGGSVFANNPYDTRLAQTFTAGLSGQLSSVDLQISDFSRAPILLSVLDGGSNFAIGSTVLGSRTFTSVLTVPQIYNGAAEHIDLSGIGINVEAGKTYTLMLDLPDGQTANASWANNSSSKTGTIYNNYAGGVGFYYIPNPPANVPSLVNAQGDFGFQTSVDVALVPEPGEWAMIAAGLSIVGTVTSRRRSAKSQAA